MGGEGSMMAANQSLKANRDSRRQKRKSFSSLQGSYSNEPITYNLPHATKDELIKIRLKLKSEKKIRNFKIYVFVSLLTIILIVFLVSIL